MIEALDWETVVERRGEVTQVVGLVITEVVRAAAEVTLVVFVAATVVMKNCGALDVCALCVVCITCLAVGIDELETVVATLVSVVLL